MILTDITCLFWHHLKTVWNAGLVLLLIAIDCKSGIKTKSTIQGKTRAEEEQLGMIFSFQWRRYFQCEGITIFLTPLFHFSICCWCSSTACAGTRWFLLTAIYSPTHRPIICTIILRCGSEWFFVSFARKTSWGQQLSMLKGRPNFSNSATLQSKPANVR